MWDWTGIGAALVALTGLITAAFAGVGSLRKTRLDAAEQASTERDRLEMSNRRLRRWVEDLESYVYRLRRLLRDAGQEPPPMPEELDHDEP